MDNAGFIREIEHAAQDLRTLFGGPALGEVPNSKL